MKTVRDRHVPASSFMSCISYHAAKANRHLSSGTLACASAATLPPSILSPAAFPTTWFISSRADVSSFQGGPATSRCNSAVTCRSEKQSEMCSFKRPGAVSTIASDLLCSLLRVLVGARSRTALVGTHTTVHFLFGGFSLKVVSTSKESWFRLGMGKRTLESKNDARYDRGSQPFSSEMVF